RPPAPCPCCMADFKRALGPFDATMVVIGGIVGAGIFVTPYIVAQRLDTPWLVLGAWVAGGAIALAGALSYAELGAVFPKAGGQYVYLRDGLHPLAGFMYGWALLLVIESGARAARRRGVFRRRPPDVVQRGTRARRCARGDDRGLRGGARAHPLHLRRLAERQLRRRGNRRSEAQPAAGVDRRHDRRRGHLP